MLRELYRMAPPAAKAGRREEAGKDAGGGGTLLKMACISNPLPCNNEYSVCNLLIPAQIISQKGVFNMKVSARNLIPGTVKKVTLGAVNAEVIIEAANGVEIVSIITNASAEGMGLKEGSKVHAMIKASNVMVVTD